MAEDSGTLVGSGELQSSSQRRTALIGGNTFHARPVQYAVVNNLAVFEGDIILGAVQEVEQTSAQLRAEMTGALASGVVVKGSQFRWPNCRIPFTIDAGLSNPNLVTDAIAHWQSRTSYTFVARSTETDFVTFPIVDWLLVFSWTSGWPAVRQPRQRLLHR